MAQYRRISLALATTSPFFGTIASTSSKVIPRDDPDLFASLIWRRAPWMPFVGHKLLRVRKLERLVIPLAEIENPERHWAGGRRVRWWRYFICSSGCACAKAAG